MRWSVLDLVLLSLASYRLTHALVFDKIAEPIRNLFPGHGWLAYLVRCYWCAGVWISGLLVGLIALWPGGSRWIIAIFAVAGAQSLVETAVRSLGKRTPPEK